MPLRTERGTGRQEGENQGSGMRNQSPRHDALHLLLVPEYGTMFLRFLNGCSYARADYLIGIL